MLTQGDEFRDAQVGAVMGTEWVELGALGRSRKEPVGRRKQSDSECWSPCPSSCPLLCLFPLPVLCLFSLSSLLAASWAQGVLPCIPISLLLISPIPLSFLPSLLLIYLPVLLLTQLRCGCPKGRVRRGCGSLCRQGQDQRSVGTARAAGLDCLIPGAVQGHGGVLRVQQGHFPLSRRLS